MDQDVLGFMDNLVSESAELASLYREHLVDQGEMLPHVLMGDIARLVVSTGARGESPIWHGLLFRQLELGLLSGSSRVAELVGVSFVENLCGETDAIAALLPQMDNALRKEVKTICEI